jgi:chemotaxis protein MotB
MKLDRDFLKAVYPKVDEGGTPPWLITFADLVSLMLVFFVMLFAMSSLEREQWRQILGRDPVPQLVEVPEPLESERSLQRAQVEAARDPDYLLSLFKTKLESEPLLKDLPMRSLGDRVVLSISADRLAADLAAGSPGGPDSLIHALGGALQTLPNQIVVDGFAPADAKDNAWRTALRLAYFVASGLEASGVDGPVLARGQVALGAAGVAGGGQSSAGLAGGGVEVALLDNTTPILAPVGDAPAP